ncbi:organelle RRM domain-containing protein 6, chloroplastic-like [Quercus robur]|uniref:organelle RRM domain-containing protein 6, chloroplastic-like n=1 Tax=Quercus robur TaxID=38942 RepID=UPI002161F25F|nr:organelle RRM domain-containing protein 6, chloroplastic-like [Quercus robur]
MHAVWFTPSPLVLLPTSKNMQLSHHIARLVKDPRTQRPKGFGFVTYESEVEAQKALKAMNGRIVDGRLIFVEVAKTEKPGEDASSQ